MSKKYVYIFNQLMKWNFSRIRLYALDCFQVHDVTISGLKYLRCLLKILKLKNERIQTLFSQHAEMHTSSKHFLSVTKSKINLVIVF